MPYARQLESHPTRVRLGDDELACVFNFATGICIDDKFAVSQVSKHWRAVALSISAFWSSFTVKTRLDASRLRTIVARTGTSLLDVSLDFSDTTTTNSASQKLPVFSASDRSTLYNIVGPHAPRVKRLCLDLGGFGLPFVTDSESLLPMFLSPTPRLEELVLTWRPPRHIIAGARWEPHPTNPITFHLDGAPRLQTLRLENIIPSSWLKVASTELRNLHVRGGLHDPYFVCTILRMYPSIRHIRLIPTNPLTAYHNVTTRPGPLTHNVEKLHVAMPFHFVHQILRQALDFTVVRDITFTLVEYDVVGKVFRELLKYLGPVVECSMARSRDAYSGRRRYWRYADSFSVVDRTGRSRRVIVPDVQTHSVEAFLSALARCQSGILELRTVTVSHYLWAVTARFFNHEGARNSIAEVRVILPESSADRLRLHVLTKFSAPRKFNGPCVMRVTFERSDDSPLKVQTILDVIDSFAPRKHANRTEICVTGRNADRSWVPNLETELERENRQNWAICMHCNASLARTDV